MATDKVIEKLRKCKDEIKKEKPKTSDVADSVDGILTASDKKHWHRIKFFKGNVSSSRQMLCGGEPPI